MLEDLDIGAPVTTATGAHLGTLSRVIVDGQSDRVLGFVVDPGLAASGNLLAPGGWSRPRERVVPTDFVASATHDNITLTCDEDAFHQLALFEREQYVDVDPAGSPDGPQEWHRRFHLGDLINYVASEFGLGGAPYLPPAQITHAEPPTAGALEEGTPVWRREPRERIGEVKRVLIDTATQRVGGLVLNRGFLPHLVLLPTSAIASLEDDLVEVNLTDAELDALPIYEPND